jgi:hypothetical protein
MQNPLWKTANCAKRTANEYNLGRGLHVIEWAKGSILCLGELRGNKIG